MRAARKEMAPADGADPEGGEVAGHAEGEPPPLGIREPGKHGADVHVPEEVDEEGDTDRDPEKDLDQPRRAGHVRLESELREDGVEAGGYRHRARGRLEGGVRILEAMAREGQHERGAG